MREGKGDLHLNALHLKPKILGKKPAEGDLKSGIPALVEMPAPHIITMLAYLPSPSKADTQFDLK